MKFHAVDVAIIVGYFAAVIIIGLWVSRRGSKDMNSYFLGGKALPWYMLGVSNASGMFDVTGTMWLVSILFVYGLKSLWLPWIWPTFNQIFLMMFISQWLRRSNVMTGAEWIQTRFGRGSGANLAHLSVVVFALVNVIGLLAYLFKGIGKFAVVMLPWRFPWGASHIFSDENTYAVIIHGQRRDHGSDAICDSDRHRPGHRLRRHLQGFAGNVCPLDSTRLDEPLFWVETRTRLDGDFRQGQ
jgi:hypothetical protein